MQDQESNSSVKSATRDEEFCPSSEAAGALLASVMEGDLSSSSIEDRLACLPRATVALLTVIQKTPDSLSRVRSPRLSRRQMEVLELLNAGLTPKEISRELCIEECTVRSHIRAICEAFEANSYREAVKEAKRMGVVNWNSANAG